MIMKLIATRYNSINTQLVSISNHLWEQTRHQLHCRDGILSGADALYIDRVVTDANRDIAEQERES